MMIRKGDSAMKINESPLDRIIRSVLGVLFFVLSLTGVITGSLGTVFMVLGAILLLTGAVGFCPLYALLKFSTNKAQ
jgi:hypothetical protein